MNSRDVAMLAAALRANQPIQRRERRGGCGCGNPLFWIAFVLMLPCDLFVLLAVTGWWKPLLAMVR